MASFVAGQLLTAAQLNAALALAYPAGNVSNFMGGVLTANSQAALLADLGLPTGAPGSANGVATLDGTGKLPVSQITATIAGSLTYIGTWNATTNVPALVSSTGTTGYYYQVAVAGTTTINGISNWNVGDIIAFNGVIWEKIDGASGPFTGDSGSGGLQGFVPAPPAGSAAYNEVLGAGGSFVGRMSGFRNRIINGSMDIDQRWGGASGTGIATYTIDRWAYNASQASKGTWGQNLNAVTTPTGFPHYLGFQSSSAYALAGSDFFYFYQSIEASNIPDWAFGTSSAQSLVMSFRVYSSLTGTFGGSIRNYGGTRSYPFTYTIPTANTWTYISLVIPGDTSGTWVLSGSAGAVIVSLDMGTGTTYRYATPGAWVSGNYAGVTGTNSVVGTSGATFYFTGVQLEIGTLATPFERRLNGIELMLCQRYFWTPQANNTIVGYAPGAGGLVYGTIAHPVPMRSTPTVSTTWTNGNNSTIYGLAAVNNINFQIYCSSAAGGEFYVSYSYLNTISAEI